MSCLEALIRTLLYVVIERPRHAWSYRRLQNDNVNDFIVGGEFVIAIRFNVYVYLRWFGIDRVGSTDHKKQFGTPRVRVRPPCI
jgi:hypothetical protein